MAYLSTFAPLAEARTNANRNRFAILTDYYQSEQRKRDIEAERLRKKREEEALRASVSARLREAAGAPVPGTMNPPTVDQSRLGVIGAIPDLYERGGSEGYNLGKGYLDLLKQEEPRNPVMGSPEWKSAQDYLFGLRGDLKGIGAGDKRPRVRAFEFNALVENDDLIKFLRERQAEAYSMVESTPDASPLKRKYRESYYNIGNAIEQRKGELIKDYQVVDDIPDQSYVIPQGGQSVETPGYSPEFLEAIRQMAQGYYQ